MGTWNDTMKLANARPEAAAYTYGVRAFDDVFPPLRGGTNAICGGGLSLRTQHWSDGCGRASAFEFVPH